MKYIEDLIPKTYQKDLLALFTSNEFPWFYQKGTIYTNKNISLQESFGNHICLDKNTTDSQQFVHVFVSDGKANSSLYSVVKPILYFIEQQGIDCTRLRRIKANMLLQDTSFPENHYNIPHVDSPNTECTKDIKSLIYYVNDSDGDTVLFNERIVFPFMGSPDQLTVNHRVTPKAGSCILFNAHTYHASTPPKVNINRMVINFLFE